MHLHREEQGQEARRGREDAALYPAVFDIDISVCMSCQICVEVCPFDAIKMDQEFEIATDNRFRPLLRDREQLAIIRKTSKGQSNAAAHWILDGQKEKTGANRHGARHKDDCYEPS